ncbi:MAG: tetratricopeptide repeat protein [Hyphomonadaceae bacterium]
MIATLRRLLLVGAAAISLSSPGLAQVSADVSKAMSQARAAYDRADYAEAVRWYRLAADQGGADAQSILGSMYKIGKGVPQNYAEALRWYRLAADQGEMFSQSSLGYMYDLGQGVPENDAEANRWYRLAADQGEQLAQYYLGVNYVLGQGVPQNYIEGYKWLNLAAAQGEADAAKARDEVRAEMTPAQVAEGQRLSAAWKPK